MLHPSHEADSLGTVSAEVGSLGDDQTSSAWRDWLGVTASILCAVHCAAMPFVVGFLPLLGLDFLADPAFHIWMLSLCIGLAFLAFVPGWRCHRRISPAVVAVCGLSLISVAAFAGDDDCCAPSAAPHQVVAVSNANGEMTPKSIEETEPAAGCEATGCAGCSVQAPAVPTDAKQAGALSMAWPWLTPGGGLLLVAAHLFNRRLTCRCCGKTEC